MPKQVNIRPVKDGKPIKNGKVLTVSYQTALENIRNSKGGYEIVPEKATKAPSTAPTLEDMPLADLKVLMLQAGVKTDKQLTRDQVIVILRKKLDAIDLVEE